MRQDPVKPLAQSLNQSTVTEVQDKPYLKGVYTGQEVRGKPHGNGFYTSESYTYTGEFKDGLMHGKGTIEDYNYQLTYTGEMKEGQITGQGKLVFVDGSEYEGSFLRGRFDGEGQFTL